MKATTAILGSLLALALAGCQTVDPTHAFGRAAREVVSLQTVNPAAATTTAPVVEGTDPELVKSSVDVLRERSAPKETRQAPR